MKGFMVLEGGVRFAVDATCGNGVVRIDRAVPLDGEPGIAEYQRIANDFVSAYAGDDPFPDAELPTTQLGPKTREDQEHFDKWQARWKATGETNDLLKSLYPQKLVEKLVYEDHPLLATLSDTPPRGQIELFSSPWLKEGEMVALADNWRLPEPRRGRWYEYAASSLEDQVDRLSRSISESMYRPQYGLPKSTPLGLHKAQQVCEQWNSIWPEMAQYNLKVGPSAPETAVAALKVGDTVRWRKHPNHVGKIVDQLSNNYHYLVQWSDGHESYMAPGDMELHVEAPPTPVATVCRCPIKDLTSIGHTDPQCPERKQKK